jgi:hypothetical protein
MNCFVHRAVWFRGYESGIVHQIQSKPFFFSGQSWLGIRIRIFWLDHDNSILVRCSLCLRIRIRMCRTDLDQSVFTRCSRFWGLWSGLVDWIQLSRFLHGGVRVSDSGVDRIQISPFLHCTYQGPAPLPIMLFTFLRLYVCVRWDCDHRV